MKTLPEYITEHLGVPFKWGVCDCCLFTVGWLENIRGEDLLSQYKPWSNATQAARILKRLGGLEKLFNATLKGVPPNMAQDGDVTIHNNTAFIFTGPHIVSVGETGLVFLDRMEAVHAWKAL